LGRLNLLGRRISDIQHEPETGRHIAVIDSEGCLGYGVCKTICPVAAISIQNTAYINASCCTGCGVCVDESPQGAIVLRPYQTAGTRASRRNVAEH
jgi:MinD superfamily P-loop ATPase